MDAAKAIDPTAQVKHKVKHTPNTQLRRVECVDLLFIVSLRRREIFNQTFVTVIAAVAEICTIATNVPMVSVNSKKSSIRVE
jgi:hypothetical protein